MALTALALAFGVILVVIATAPFFAVDAEWGFGARLGLVAFVIASLVIVVTYRASCKKGR